MKKYLFVIVGILIGLSIMTFLGMKSDNDVLGSLPFYQDGFVTATTNSTSSVSTLTGGSTVLSVNPRRSYARITNIGTADVWCNLATSATISTGFKIAPSSTYPGSWLEFGRSHVPSSGQVQCISSATTTVTVIEN